MRNLHFRNPISPLPMLCGLSLVLIGSFGPWLTFPLSAPVYVFDVGTPLTVGAICIIAVAFTGIGWIFQFQFLLTIGLVMMALVPSRYFLDTWLTNAHRMTMYVNESDQRWQLQEFLSSNYWPNGNPEPGMVLIREVGNLIDRFALAWHMTSWGWTLSAVGIILLLISGQFSSLLRIPCQLAVIVTLVLSGLTAYPAISAENNRQQGDFLVTLGRAGDAIDTYRDAMNKDPFLQFSRPFVIQLSRIYYAAEGRYSTMAAFYLANRQISSQSQQGRILNGDRINAARRYLLPALLRPIVSDSLETAVIRQSEAEDIRLLILKGISDIEQGDLASAVEVFQQTLERDSSQLHVQFLLAHALRLLGQYDDSIGNLEAMLLSVANDNLRADIICTIGDAHREAGNSLQARTAYTECLDSDSLFNYRAVKQLGGI